MQEGREEERIVVTIVEDWTEIYNMIGFGLVGRYNGNMLGLEYWGGA